MITEYTTKPIKKWVCKYCIYFCNYVIKVYDVLETHFAFIVLQHFLGQGLQISPSLEEHSTLKPKGLFLSKRARGLNFALGASNLCNCLGQFGPSYLMQVLTVCIPLSFFMFSSWKIAGTLTHVTKEPCAVFFPSSMSSVCRH